MVRLNLLAVIVLLTWPTSAPPAWGQEAPIRFTARVVEVAAGDQLDVAWGDARRRLRLAGVRCPRAPHLLAPEARIATARMVSGREVRVEVVGREQDRLLAWVTLPDGRLLNAELLRAGLAWLEPTTHEDPRLAEAEAEARSAARGLWSDPSFRPPSPPPPRISEPAAPPPVRPALPPQARGCIPRSQCCRVCTKGQACGNSCISARYTCHKGRGCACDSWEVCG
jgi:endonuclease YncB( thermonuclease family)